ncbi:ABC transporter ATP-binding protein [Clostridia bacterium]|nr:ABC transporter ATP-binding protein [Clostridia bacterium]
MKKDKTKKQKPKYSIISNMLYLLKDIFIYSKLYFVLLLTEMVCASVSPMLGLYMPKFAIDLVENKADVTQIIATLGLLVLAMTTVGIIQSFCGNGGYVYKNNLRAMVYFKKILSKSLDCDYRNLESAEGQIRRQKALRCFYGGDGSSTTRLIDELVGIFSSVICFILYSGLLSLMNPLIMLFLVALTLLNFGVSELARKYDEKHRTKFSEIERKLGYIEKNSRDVNAGKDVRIYSMKRWFVSLRNSIFAEYRAVKNDIDNRYFTAGIAHLMVLLLRDGLTYGYLIWMVSGNKITVGDFMLYFGAITGFSGFIGGIAGRISSMNGLSVSLCEAREFLEYSDAPEPENPVDIPELKSIMSISFKNVNFSYMKEKDTIKVLDNLSFEIKSGEKIALVGVNGAGKTTIVKLLCGFYYPDSGEILINGTDIKNFRKKDLFRLFSAIFQDIVIFPVTVGENVSMRLTEESDADKIWKCLETAGLADELKKYEDGINLPMTKQFEENGVVLSGGQLQKLLMARALYKDALVLIFDEPTAALDPIAESEIYEKFSYMAQNKTVIYISHRLASTRFCDRIAYLKDGRISESGSHAELMRKGGDYAYMFDIQSHYYKEENNVNTTESGEAV